MWWRCVHVYIGLFLALSALLVRAAQSPSVNVSTFPNIPAQIKYFEDSSVVLWHDSIDGIVYRSADEGMTWAPVSGPPMGHAYMLILHPYEPSQAFILSNGNDHWRSVNRGESWQRFSTPDPPSLSGVSPLDFHADPQHKDWILYIGRRCSTWFFRTVCQDTAYYTTDGFASDAKLLLDLVDQCHWAKMTPEVAVAPQAMQRILCIAWDESAKVPPLAHRTGLDAGSGAIPSTVGRAVPPAARASSWMTGMGKRDVRQSRLFMSDDLFNTRIPVSLEGRLEPRGFLNMGKSGEFLVAALSDAQSSTPGELRLYVSRDAERWRQAQFPHAPLAHETGYTILEGPQHRLLVDMLDQTSRTSALFMSDSTGTNFSSSIVHTQRNADGIIDYEHLTNMEGAAIVNVKVEGALDRVQTRITHDEGASWTPLQPPSTDVDGRLTGCKYQPPSSSCALHLHAVLSIRNLGHVFSSTAPGLVMGVGSIGDRLRPYAECDTFLSTDAGLTWRMVARHPHRHTFADQGGLLVMAEDASSVDTLLYSFDYGSTWTKLPLPMPIEPVVLTTAPDGTALKILLMGSRPRGTASLKERHVAIFLDFAGLSKRKCAASDFEKFYPATPHSSCLFGHRQWYMRRKPQADCFVRDKFHEPKGHDEPCACTRADYECDMGFVREQGECRLKIKLPVPPGECVRGAKTFKGPSGYRKIPGNTCEPDPKHGTPALDAPVDRPCTDAVPAAGSVSHVKFEFPSRVADILHFPASPRILARLYSGDVYQSTDDGSSWHALDLRVPGHRASSVLQLVQHPHDKQRAYLITQGKVVHYTRDGGVHWKWFEAPIEANGVGFDTMGFHAQHPSWVLWTGSRDCLGDSHACQTELWYTKDERYVDWRRAATHVRKCAFLRATMDFAGGDRDVVCELEEAPETQSHRGRGSKLLPGQRSTPRQVNLVVGGEFFTRGRRVVMPDILGFSVFSQYMLVAKLTRADSSAVPSSPSSAGSVSSPLHMHVSMDARTFAPISLPPMLDLAHSAYTVLDSVTRAVFLHVTTTRAHARAQWGDIIKSNSNGTYFALSLPNVNRNAQGFVDFEKMQGLDGIAFANVVANTDDASVSGVKELRTVITHNDGGSWNPITMPSHDSLGAPYACDHVGCNLHLRNLLERPNLRVTLTSPSATGFMLATGNVGRSLKPYEECDTFFTRDGGFSWEEMRKGTHLWEFGDHGSVIVLVDDTQPTDSVEYTLDQGLTWHVYHFGERMHVHMIDTVPEDTKRKFVLLGEAAGRSMAVFLDFSHVLSRACEWDAKDEVRSDFEKWSPSQQRAEPCLFGQQTWLWRRKRDRICYVGDVMPQQSVEKTPCTCSAADFECEFNHFRNATTGVCVPYAGVSAPVSPTQDDHDTQCARDAPDYDGFWYERTNVRKIPLSRCLGGERPDRGRRHRCRSRYGIGTVLWYLVFVPCLLLGSWMGVSWLMMQRERGTITLPELEHIPIIRHAMSHAESGIHVARGYVSMIWANILAFLHDMPITRDILRRSERPFSHYHMLSTDEDAEILQGYEASDIEE